MTPESFISNDFTPDLDEDLEMLKSNEYFAKRWWELLRLEYNHKIPIFLISCHDLQQTEKKFVIDTRQFNDYNVCHFKGSFHMNLGEDQSTIKTYCKFMQAYQQLYTDNFIVLVGDESDMGVELG